MADLSPEEMLYPQAGQLKTEVVWPAGTMAKSRKLAVAALPDLIRLGYTQADADGLSPDARKPGAMRWTAYLAYRGRLSQMGGLPGAVDVRDQGSSSYSADQRAEMRRFMEDELAAYQEVLAAEAVDGTSPEPRSSRSVRFDVEIG